MDDASLLERVVGALQGVPGLAGIVLGGSRAKGTHTAESDFDVGLFFRDEKHFDIGALARVAAELDDDGRTDLVTPVGGWGPWVVGGGWLKIDGRPVDFIYREIPRVACVIADCRAGIVDLHYQPAYTVGYLSATYMAEVDACRILHDPSGEIAALKSQTRPYPEALSQGIFDKLSWVPRFALVAGKKCAPRGDIVFASSTLYWATYALCQMLFAANGEYLLNEKGAVALVDALAVRPPDFRARVERVFLRLAPEASAMLRAFDELLAVIDDAERALGRKLPEPG